MFKICLSSQTKTTLPTPNPLDEEDIEMVGAADTPEETHNKKPTQMISQQHLQSILENVSNQEHAIQEDNNTNQETNEETCQ